MPRDLMTNPEIVAPAALDAEGEILERAACAIESTGWYSASQWGPENDGSDPWCMMNAIAVSGGDGRGQEFARRLGFPDLQTGWTWNDAPGRRKAEVIARLRSAARGTL